MASSPHITPGLYKFLRDLKKNNDRTWFTDNRDRYEEVVRQPLLELINDFRPRLHRISKHFVADPRPSGGSLFRQHRDVRFSKDKSPYKVHAGIQFRHEAAKDVHAPGFYLHLEPGEVFVGIGIWHPDSATLKKIRSAIVDDSTKWKRAIGSKTFTSRFERRGDSLSRPPRGFDKEHPLVDDLKLKDHIAVCELKQSQTTKASFLSDFEKICKASKAYVRFLTEAVDLPF